MEFPEGKGQKEKEIDSEIQTKLNQIFSRSARMLEQAEFLFPEETLAWPYGGGPESKWLKDRAPHYVFHYSNGRSIHLFGSRSREKYSFAKSDPNTRWTPQIWDPAEDNKLREITISLLLPKIDRIKLKLFRAPFFPSEVALRIKQNECGPFVASLEDFSPKIIEKLSQNENPACLNLLSFKNAKPILERTIALLARSPVSAQKRPDEEVRKFGNLNSS